MPKPMYRYNNPQVGHLYATDWNELQNGNYGYTLERTECLVEDGAVNGAVPWHRFRHNTKGTHFYTANLGEFQVESTFSNYTHEGVIGYVYPANNGALLPLYRYYHPALEDHFYTTFKEHRSNPGMWGEILGGRAQIAIPGYNLNGVACYVLDSGS